MPEVVSSWHLIECMYLGMYMRNYESQLCTDLYVLLDLLCCFRQNPADYAEDLDRGIYPWVLLNKVVIEEAGPQGGTHYYVAAGDSRITI